MTNVYMLTWIGRMGLNLYFPEDETGSYQGLGMGLTESCPACDGLDITAVEVYFSTDPSIK